MVPKDAENGLKEVFSARSKTIDKLAGFKTYATMFFIGWDHETVPFGEIQRLFSHAKLKSPGTHIGGLYMRVMMQKTFRAFLETKRHNHQIWMIRQHLACDTGIGWHYWVLI